MSETFDRYSFAGTYLLDGVDFGDIDVKERFCSSASTCRFRLDGKVYVAVEDPEDGYRSCLQEILISADTSMSNTFPPVEVRAEHLTGHKDYYGAVDLVRFVDVVTRKPVLDIGTSNTDDYYPSFVASFMPENMTTNAKIPVLIDIDEPEKKGPVIEKPKVRPPGWGVFS